MIQYKSGYKYQLYKPYSIVIPVAPGPPAIGDTYFCGPFLSLSAEGQLRIEPGYAWDGCSGPTWDDNTNMEAGLVHDALYQFIRNKILSESVFREVADNMLYDIMYAQLLEDEPWWRPAILHKAWAATRAGYYYKAVRAFGGAAVKKPREILEAP